MTDRFRGAYAAQKRHAHTADIILIFLNSFQSGETG
jgi:hypothetical protein